MAHEKQFSCSLNRAGNARKFSIWYKGVKNFDSEPVNQLEQ